MSEALATLNQSPKLLITQQKEWGEIVSGWETRNRYVVSTAEGAVLLYAGEVGGSAMEFLTRTFLKSKRPFKIELRDGQNNKLLTIERPFTWFFSRAEMVDNSGTVIGRVQQHFAWLNRRFSITDRRGQKVGLLTGSLFKPWTFPLHLRGRPAGQISKKWSGLLKEAFTDADTFGIEFGEGLDQDFRLVCLGATFLIDFLYFENKN